MTAFTPEAARAVPGAPWLAARRAAAAERAAGAEQPTTAEEVWRYGRIDGLDLDRFAPVDATAPLAVPEGVADVVGLLDRWSATVVVVDGRVVSVEVDPALLGRGLSVGGADEKSGGLLGSVVGEPADLFGHLNDAFMVDPVVVDIAAGLVVPDPILVLHWHTTAGTVSFPRLFVQAGADSDATVVQAHRSAPVDGLTIPVTELHAAPAARLNFLDVQDVGGDVWQLGTQASDVESQATLRSGAVALGGEYARLRLDCRLTGRGATGNLSSAYFGSHTQTIDLRTFQDHRAPDTTSNLLFKGAVAGSSRAVYTGLIRVRPEARGTDARQTNRNIKLSPDAWAESVPNLEIENNDVRCAHASAVGPVDQEQRFYLESRGVPSAIAERMIVGGFFDEVVDSLPAPGLAGAIRYRLAQELEANHG